MYDIMRLVTCLVAICLPIQAYTLQNDHLKLPSTSNVQNPPSFDVQPFKWSQSTEDEIKNVTSVIDDIIIEVIDILPNLITENNEKSRFKRNTLDNAFGEQTICHISEDELNSMKTVLLGFHTSTAQLTTENIASNSDNCTRLFLEIKNLIINLINNFIDLKNVQLSAVDFETMKKSYEDKINVLQSKFDNFEKKSSQQIKSKINQFIETIQSLKQQSETLVRNLENERNAHRNTKIRFCISEIKTNQVFPECHDLFKSENTNTTLINYIVSTSYENKIERISPIIKLSIATPYYVTTICIFEALLREMERNGHNNSPMVLEIHYYIDYYMQQSNFNLRNIELKSRYESAKRKAKTSFNTILNTWVSEIRSGRYDGVVEFELTYWQAFLAVCDILTEKTYSNNLDYADKFITYLKAKHKYICDTKMTRRLFDLMKSNNHLTTPQGMKLTWCIRYFIRADAFTTLSEDIKQQWNSMKNELPCGISRLFFVDEPEVRSDFHKEYLYAANSHFGDHRRNVFTWRPGNPVLQSNWKFETTDGQYFKIYNTHHNEYLYAANDELKYDNDRRTVLTWDDSSYINDKFYWEIIPRDSNTFYIKNKYFGEYLYSADYRPFDNNRRRVFTWVPNRDITGSWDIGDCLKIDFPFLMRIISVKYAE